MTSSSDQRNPVELLAEEFLDRKRRGERPTFQEYLDRHPQLAEEIRDLFPALLMMEDLGESSGGTTDSLAAQLLGKMTSASQAAIRAEHKLIVQEALNGMDPIDREVLALRHYEQLSNDETALVLGLSKKGASNRYIRALRRLKEILSSIPGMNEGW